MTTVFALVFAAVSAVPPDLPFTAWFTSRGVKVEIARPPQGPPWLRGTADLPASADAVFGMLAGFRLYREIFAPAVKTATVLESADGSARLHLVWLYPFPLRNRDAVVAYRARRADEGFVISWEAGARPGDPREGVRIERVAGETRVEPLAPDRCRVVYTYLGDLGGSFPGWAQEKAWREEPVQYMRAIRKRLRLPDSGE